MAYTSNSKEVVIGRIEVSETNEVRVTRIESQDGDLEAVDVRQWYCTKADPEKRPTQKGVRIRAEDMTSFVELLAQSCK